METVDGEPVDNSENPNPNNPKQIIAPTPNLDMKHPGLELQNQVFLHSGLISIIRRLITDLPETESYCFMNLLHNFTLSYLHLNIFIIDTLK